MSRAAADRLAEETRSRVYGQHRTAWQMRFLVELWLIASFETEPPPDPGGNESWL